MKVNPIPEGYHTVTPYLAVRNAKQTLEFLKMAFDAKVIAISEMNGMIMNCEVKVGTSMVMLGDMRPGEEPWNAMLYMYVDDCDKLFKSAVSAGGKVVHEMTDQFYGDRSGAVEDPSGNQWWIASRKENVSKEELEKRVAKFRK